MAVSAFSRFRFMLAFSHELEQTPMACEAALMYMI